MINILDSHVHFFDPTRSGGIDWPAADSPLHRTTMPSDLIATTAPLQLSGCIAIETSRRPADDQWLLALAAKENLVRGVVLNLQPDLPGFEDRLASAMTCNKFVGIRLRPIEHYDLASERLLQNFQLLEQNTKTIEFGARTSNQKQAFAALAWQFPKTTWILDHCGHPPSDTPPDKNWLADMGCIAASPNVVTKITNAGQLLKSRPATLGDMIIQFGVDRILYGSNWPVSAPNTEYDNTVLSLADHLGDDSDAFFSANATRAYRTNQQHGRG